MEAILELIKKDREEKINAVFNGTRLNDSFYLRIKITKQNDTTK